jgi:hypothetical protein
MPQIYSPNSAPNRHAPPSSGSSGQDLAGAVICVLLMLVSGAGAFKAINGAIAHETMTLTDKRGNNPVQVAAFSPIWWVMLLLCAGTFLYCGFLLVQQVRKGSS